MGQAKYCPNYSMKYIEVFFFLKKNPCILTFSIIPFSSTRRIRSSTAAATSVWQYRRTSSASWWPSAADTMTSRSGLSRTTTPQNSPYSDHRLLVFLRRSTQQRTPFHRYFRTIQRRLSSYPIKRNIYILTWKDRGKNNAVTKQHRKWHSVRTRRLVVLHWVLMAQVIDPDVWSWTQWSLTFTLPETSIEILLRSWHCCKCAKSTSFLLTSIRWKRLYESRTETRHLMPFMSQIINSWKNFLLKLFCEFLKLH